MKKDFIRKIALLIFGGAFSSTALHAGGMGPVVNTHNWTGFYLGANGGAQWASFSGGVTVDTFVFSSLVLGPSFQSYKEELTSFTGGGQLGYNYQYPNNWVVGAEFQFNGEQFDKIHYVSAAEILPTSVFVAGNSYSVSNNWHTSLLGRVGYTWNNWLLYATGGVSLADAQFSANFIRTAFDIFVFPQASGSSTKVLVGGTAGLGLSYALAPYIQIGVEGRYTDYGIQNFNLVPVPVVAASTGQALFSPSTGRLDTSTEEVMVKINYQFS